MLYASGRMTEILTLFSGCLKEHHNNRKGYFANQKVLLQARCTTCDLEHKDSKALLCLTRADYRGQHCVRPLQSLPQNTQHKPHSSTLALLSMQSLLPAFPVSQYEVMTFPKNPAVVPVKLPAETKTPNNYPVACYRQDTHGGVARKAGHRTNRIWHFWFCHRIS